MGLLSAAMSLADAKATQSWLHNCAHQTTLCFFLILGVKIDQMVEELK